MSAFLGEETRRWQERAREVANRVVRPLAAKYDHLQQYPWEIKDAIPGAKVTLKWTTFLTDLDNGNLIVGNCHAGEKSPQLFEITRDKKVVWQFNRYDTFGNGLACSQVLNDQQSALVRKLLAGAARGGRRK